MGPVAIGAAGAELGPPSAGPWWGGARVPRHLPGQLTLFDPPPRDPHAGRVRELMGRVEAQLAAPMCDQCSRPFTTSTWFRLTDTDRFVSTKRCDAHPFHLPSRPADPSAARGADPTRKGA